MKYWVYLNEKVTGPFTADKLVTLNGFTPDTLICSEDAANSGNQAWVKASSVFEFEQPEQTPTPAPMPTSAPLQTTPVATTTAEDTNAELTNMLLSKIDALNVQIVSMQAKLDQSISAQEREAQEAASRTKALTEQFSQLVATQHDFLSQIPKQVTDIPTENLDNHSDELLNTIPTESQLDEPVGMDSSEQPLPVLKEQESQLEPIEENLESIKEEPLNEISAESSPEYDLLSTKGGDALVLNSALDSLHHKEIPNKKEKKTSEQDFTFQDLLTPAHADASTQENQPQETDTKDEVLAELTQPPQEDVVDQVIKEKEAEETEHKKSMTMRILAGAVALAGAVGLKKKNTDGEKPTEGDKLHIASEQENLPVLETKNVPPVEAELKDLQPAEKQTLDFDQPIENAPSLSIVDANTSSSKESIQSSEENQAQEQAQVVSLPQDNEMQESQQLEEQSALQDTPEEQAQLQAEVIQEQKESLPSIEESNKPQEAEVSASENDSPEELVANATTNKTEDIISEDDLKQAFNERKSEDPDVESLFGLASAGAATAAVLGDNETSAEQASNVMPSLEEVTPQSAPTLEAPQPKQDPNDLTEIELKEGSTYLISDFVPPEVSPKANTAVPVATTPKDKDAKKNDFALEEMVTQPPQTKENKEKKTEPKAENSTEVTVSQVILENTIKAKRGAALDIKTVPMVPEPADSDRLQVEGFDDDINAQHDLRSADVEPSGKKTKMVMGLILVCLLFGAIYAMLAWMNLIPAQFNVLLNQKKTAQEAQQNEQLQEMLGPTQDQLPIQTVDAENTPVSMVNPQDAILEEVKNYTLPNEMTLKNFIESKHPTSVDLITWEISTAVDPDNYSVLVKVPPENPQSFKISYRFNYNTVTKALDPTISDAKNLLDSAQAQENQPIQPAQ